MRRAPASTSTDAAGAACGCRRWCCTRATTRSSRSPKGGCWRRAFPARSSSSSTRATTSCSSTSRRGQRFCEAVLDFRARPRRRRRRYAAFAALSPREREVLALITEGLANARHRRAPGDQREDRAQPRLERVRQARRVDARAGHRVRARPRIRPLTRVGWTVRAESGHTVRLCCSTSSRSWCSPTGRRRATPDRAAGASSSCGRTATSPNSAAAPRHDQQQDGAHRRDRRADPPERHERAARRLHRFHLRHPGHRLVGAQLAAPRLEDRHRRRRAEPRLVGDAVGAHDGGAARAWSPGTTCAATSASPATSASTRSPTASRPTSRSRSTTGR